MHPSDQLTLNCDIFLFCSCLNVSPYSVRVLLAANKSFFDRTVFFILNCRLMETMRVMGDEICFRAKECKLM